MKLKKPIKEIEKLIDYSFKKKKYLNFCLIHPSFYKNDIKSMPEKRYGKV